MEACVFCGNGGPWAPDEHVIPKWARRAFGIKGHITVSASTGGSPLEPVGRMPALNVVLRDAICQKCNNNWLGMLEKRTARILKAMAASAKPRVLSPADQATVAFWAVKTGLLLELAIRQLYPGSRRIEGYKATPQEFAWLYAHREPPPRCMVWIGCWDCEQQVPVNYEPSAANLPTSDDTAPIPGHLATYALGYVAFQVFTVDFIAADKHQAPVWNREPPPAIAGALPRIWPPQLNPPDIEWPPPAFHHDAWKTLVTWDGALRPHDRAQRPT